MGICPASGQCCGLRLNEAMCKQGGCELGGTNDRRASKLPPEEITRGDSTDVCVGVGVSLGSHRDAEQLSQLLVFAAVRQHSAIKSSSCPRCCGEGCVCHPHHVTTNKCHCDKVAARQWQSSVPEMFFDFRLDHNC